MPPAGSQDDPLFIGVAGGSGSGKTTIANALVRDLDDQAALIEHDAYYRHRPDKSFEERAKVNYDHPVSLETELLVQHLGELRAGKTVEKPVYDFGSHLRSERTVEVRPAAVVVVEGILVLAEPALRQQLDVKVFVETDGDVRLARRLQRDIEERGRTLDSVIEQYFATVRPMHLEFVEPSKLHADLVVPGFDPAGVVAVVELIRSHL